MISPLPGVTAGKPGSAMKTDPRRRGAASSTTTASRSATGSGGYLVLTEPWPSMLRTLWGDDDRFNETYWSRFKGNYFAGDGAKLDDDGDIWLLGRVDDVMNVSGHRLSTTEIESALVSHPKVAEAAVVGADRRRRPGRRSPRSSSCASTRGRRRRGRGRGAARPRREARSARSRSRSRSWSCRSCRRRGRARSCAGCSATSPRTARPATSRRWPTRRVMDLIKDNLAAGKGADED